MIMPHDQLLQKLKDTVIDGDHEGAENAAKEALAQGMDPFTALNEGLMKGIREIGARFERLEAFILDLTLAGEAMIAALAILKPEMIKQTGSKSERAKIVIGTVQGDVHDIGKNLVGTMLTAEGYEIIDVGTDVPARKFVEKAEEVEADIIAVSALMSATRPYQRDIVNLLKDKGIRESFKVIVGGGSVNKEWAKGIGADGYGKDAIEAVKVVKQLLT